MTIDLVNVEFVNDIFSTMLPDGSSIILNKVDENFMVEGEKEGCIVKAVNIEIIDIDGIAINCPCIIGLGNDYMKINTDYSEYEGAVLTPDNMMYCTIEVYE